MVGKDGGIHTTWWHEGQHWADWSRIGRPEHNVQPNSMVTALARTPDQLDVFVVGHDGGIYSTAWNSQTGSTTDFADWLGVNPSARLATGTLRGASLSLSGPVLGGPGASFTDGSFTGFGQPFFSPRIPRTDAVGIHGLAGHSFVLKFGSPVADPLLYFATLASKVEFPPGTVLSKVSGQETFTVSENTVTGAIGPSGQTGDANGTVRVSGVFESLSFSVTPLFTAPVGDGIYLQVAAAPTPAPPWAEWFRIVAHDCIRLHMKVLLAPSLPGGIPAMVASMQQVFEPFGIRVEWVTTENLNLPAFLTLPVGACAGTTTPAQDQLFANRNFVGPGDIVIYFIQQVTPGNFNGCATHPPGRPGAVVVQGASTWTLAHEVGHILGLNPHVDDPPPPDPSAPPPLLDRLMTGRGTFNITNPPPDLAAGELTVVRESELTDSC